MKIARIFLMVFAIIGGTSSLHAVPLANKGVRNMDTITVESSAFGNM